MTTTNPPLEIVTDVKDDRVLNVGEMEKHHEEWHSVKSSMVYEIFNSQQYTKYFAKNDGWIQIRYSRTLVMSTSLMQQPRFMSKIILHFCRFVMKQELHEGNYELIFKAKRGLQEEEIVAIDNVILKHSFTMKTDDEIGM